MLDVPARGQEPRSVGQQGRPQLQPWGNGGRAPAKPAEHVLVASVRSTRLGSPLPDSPPRNESSVGPFQLPVRRVRVSTPLAATQPLQEVVDSTLITASVTQSPPVLTTPVQF